ncbi:MAG: hypothetical protein EBV08_08195 [Synechococcaceae bacterium WB6_1B_055]|nr:hypothetical protein [Synechococcaceae bacterium WB6_1B_055]
MKPFTKLNPIDNQISSRDFLAGITGTERPNLARSANNTSIVRWTLQQGTGDGGNMRNFPQAVSSYSAQELIYIQSALSKYQNIANISFQFGGINNPFPVDMVVRIQDGAAGNTVGNSARTEVDFQNRYVVFDSTEADKFYAELRLSSNYNSYDNVSNVIRNIQYRPGSFGYMTILHELGHNLGLKHTDDTTLFPGVTAGNSNTDYGTYGLNNTVATVMSYNSTSVTNQRTGVNNPALTPSSINVNTAAGNASQANLGFSRTPMALDVATIQKIYGKNNNYNLTDNTYVIPQASDANNGWACIWDAGGIDTFAAPNTSKAVQIDLRNANLLNDSTAAAGFYTYVLEGSQGGFTIAHDWNGVSFGTDIEGINIGQCVIENARGGKGSDTIIGNRLANDIWGYDGNDNITCGDGNDTAYGDIGNDFIYGNPGNDILIGGSGSDVIQGGKGNDHIYGSYLNTVFGDDRFGGSSTIGADGIGDIDTLSGNLGDDKFYLFGNGRAAYNDREDNTDGRNDYALITDFGTPGLRSLLYGEDKIVLLGSSNDYLLSANGNNTEIFLKSTVQGGVNELIAIINNVNSLSLDGTSFEYVAGNPAF